MSVVRDANNRRGEKGPEKNEIGKNLITALKTWSQPNMGPKPGTEEAGWAVAVWRSSFPCRESCQEKREDDEGLYCYQHLEPLRQCIYALALHTKITSTGRFWIFPLRILFGTFSFPEPVTRVGKLRKEPLPLHHRCVRGAKPAFGPFQKTMMPQFPSTSLAVFAFWRGEASSPLCLLLPWSQCRTLQAEHLEGEHPSPRQVKHLVRVSKVSKTKGQAAHHISLGFLTFGSTTKVSSRA